MQYKLYKYNSIQICPKCGYVFTDDDYGIKYIYGGYNELSDLKELVNKLHKLKLVNILNDPSDDIDFKLNSCCTKTVKVIISWINYALREFKLMIPEHIEKTCLRCNYSWKEECFNESIK